MNKKREVMWFVTCLVIAIFVFGIGYFFGFSYQTFSPKEDTCISASAASRIYAHGYSDAELKFKQPVFPISDWDFVEVEYFEECKTSSWFIVFDEYCQTDKAFKSCEKKPTIYCVQLQEKVKGNE